MRWGISFSIESEFEAELYGIPPPSSKRYLTRMGKTNMINVLYHFQYTPQSWKEWQRVASIKIQIKEMAPHINFVEYEEIDECEILYTVSELGKYFTKFIKYQKPLYPSSKEEFMRNLTLYAQRLLYERQFHIEAVLAMAIHFNNKCDFNYSFRELNRKSRAIFELDTDKWKTKLSDNERHKILSESAYKSAQIKREKSQTKRDEVKSLRADGKTLKDISTSLDISISTVRRYIA